MSNENIQHLMLLRVLERARCIRHWHDRVYLNGDEGMVVSADAVRDLWTALAEYDAACSSD